MKITVYLPTRNRLELLKKAVDSVLTQTYQDLELIIINEASTDGTSDYLVALSQSDTRVKYFTNSVPMGAPAARNKAIKEASGEFVTGLDDDDYFHPQRLEVFLKAWDLMSFSGLAPSLLYAQDLILLSGTVVQETTKRGCATYCDMFRANDVGNQAFAPKKHYLEVGLFDEEMPAWQDLDLFMRMIKQFGPARLVDTPTYYFDCTPTRSRISTGSDTRIRLAFERLLQKTNPTNEEASHLFLQIFSEYYNNKPSWNDLNRLAQWGLSFSSIQQLWRAYRRSTKGRT